MNETRLFNDGWKFAKTDLDVVSSQELIFEPVSIPHDWLIYNTENLYENSIGWYRKEYEHVENNQKILLCFDGVYMDSYLYINGRLIGTWKYGYSSFEHDITHALHDGINEILLKVVHQSPNSRWYSGAGIYRNVWLKTRGSNHIVTDGLYISTQQSEDGWQVEIDTNLILNTNVSLSHTICFGDDVIVTSSQEIKTNPGAKLSAVNSEITNTQHLYVKKPKLWSPDSPSLYQITTMIKGIQEEPIEIIRNNLGFRSIGLDPNHGFIINGTRLKLYGVCEHHDFGALGAAFNKTALIRRLKLLKEMGVNAIRTSHNMPAPELMDLADEMGFLMISEAFDMWERSKTTYDYARFFNEWVDRDVKSWVMRDRNHPSLFLWSIGNEIYDTHVDERGMELTKKLKKLVSIYDPRENASVTFGSNYIPWENTQKCADVLKVVGYNYAARYYNEHHIKYPDWVIYGSETCSTVQSRGIYHFPFEQSLMADDDEQCSSLGNSSTSWGAASTEDCIISDRDTPFSLGQFIWTGFDYIGEPTPYHTKNSYFGQLDTATFKKDSFYIYQAEWTDYRKSPMVHIFPYWDFSIGQQIDVRVCSNAPLIELFLNGVSMGKYSIDHVKGKELVGTWKLPYEPGELKAIAYDEDGNIIATDIRRSFGDATSIKLCADKYTMISDGQDIIFLEISMEDKDGNPVENANNRVHVNVTGAGSLIGLDNGDSTDYDQYKGKSRRLFSGKLMALIGSSKNPGKVFIEVSSMGMDTVSAEFEAISDTASLTGVASFIGNTALPIVTGNSGEIPLRKIEIVLDKDNTLGNILDSKKTEITAKAVLHPANTSYKDVEWTIVNASGIPINNAKIEGSGLEVKVLAMADGDFYLRCSSHNGTHKTKLISHMEFTAKGIGTFYKNPYEFISAGLYDYCEGTVGNGNEKGIATMYDDKTIVAYQNIDFGSYGSNKITIPIFALNDEEYPIQIWEGIPGEMDSSLLTEVVYQKPSIWNVYQEDTYILPRRLKGVTSISLVLQNKVHIKGFTFEKINGAFEQNYASECDNIYGDDYKVLESNLLHVGNNISLEYNDMDFSDDGTTKLIIHGKSHIDKNTIVILIENKEGKRRQLISFVKSDGLSTQTFEIENIKGINKVTFIFLPGSDFDFEWFRFDA
ncbi:MAG: DUF4982 domain-containing protein [Clostridiales bacterium]|jgi:beta-galactosidase|nr:DUF4982 domain-containing protein [Clostridiales bacterium]